MPPNQKIDRNLDILEKRRSGKTLDAIAFDFGITRERVRVICLGMERYLKRNSQDDPLNGLTVRARSVLGCLDAKTPEDVSKLIAKQITKIPNSGKKTLQDIETWLDRHGLKLADHN